MEEPALANATTDHRPGSSSVQTQRGRDVQEGNKLIIVFGRELIIQSLLFLLLLPIVLWCSHGQPLLAVWRLSLLFCSYFFLWASMLSVITRLFFFCVSCGALLAFFADAVLNPAAGMVIVYLDSVLAAGWVGYAFAKHRESEGTENAAAVAVAATPVPATEQEKNFRASLNIVFFMIAMIALGSVARAAWMVCHSPDYSMVQIATFLSSMLSVLLFYCISSVLALLDGAILGDPRDESALVLCWFILVFILFLLSLILLGDFMAMVVVWFCVLGSTVFFGYCLCVHASYKQALRCKLLATLLEQKEQINEKQAAGLEGLDESKNKSGRQPGEDLIIYIVIS